MGKVILAGQSRIAKLATNRGQQLELGADTLVLTSTGFRPAGALNFQELPSVLPNIYPVGDPKCIPTRVGRSGRSYGVTSTALMESLGFMQGDGGIRSDVDVSCVYYTPDKDGEFIFTVLRPTFDDIAANPGEIDYQASQLSNDRTGFRWCRKKLNDFLRQIGIAVGKLPERHLPEFVFKAPFGGRAAFLRGLFGANGSVISHEFRQVVTLTSTCRPMLRQVQLLLQSMAIASAVRRHNAATKIEWENGIYTSRESYHLEITHARDVAAFARHVGFPQKQQAAKLAAILKTELARSNDSALAKRTSVKTASVEHLNETDTVFSIQVPTTHCALANGLVVGDHSSIEGRWVAPKEAVR